MTLPAFFLSGFGVILDVIDGVMFFATPDAVIAKSTLNLGASCIKWMSFGFILGAGTQDFMNELYEMQCFNKEGMT